MFYNFTQHFSSLFKKTVKNKKQSLNIQSARVMSYSADRASEVFVKYTSNDTEKCNILKKGATASLPLTSTEKVPYPSSHQSNKSSWCMKGSRKVCTSWTQGILSSHPISRQCIIRNWWQWWVTYFSSWAVMNTTCVSSVYLCKYIYSVSEKCTSWT